MSDIVAKIPVTQRGYRKVSDELKHLKEVERPEVIASIASAREHGDLSENAEYAAAREKQSFIEGRIFELEHFLARSEVIDPKRFHDMEVVQFGATVTLKPSEGAGEVKTYQLVSEMESNIKEGKLSVKAPLAAALLNKKLGDRVQARTPTGIREYKIIKLEYI